MSLLATCLVAALVATAAGRPAKAVEAREVVQSCRTVVVGTQRSTAGPIAIPKDGLLCWNYVAAIQDLSVLVDQNSSRLLGVCAPETTTLLDYVRTLVQYAKRNPITGRQNAGAFAVAALNEAFPCRAENAANPPPRSRKTE